MADTLIPSCENCKWIITGGAYIKRGCVVLEYDDNADFHLRVNSHFGCEGCKYEPIEPKEADNG